MMWSYYKSLKNDRNMTEGSSVFILELPPHKDSGTFDFKLIVNPQMDAFVNFVHSSNWRRRTAPLFTRTWRPTSKCTEPTFGGDTLSTYSMHLQQTSLRTASSPRSNWVTANIPQTSWDMPAHWTTCRLGALREIAEAFRDVSKLY